MKQGDAPSRRRRRQKYVKLKPYLGKVDELLAAGVYNAVAELLNPKAPIHRKALTRLGEAIQAAVARFNPFRKMIYRIRKARANRAAARC